MSSRLIFKLKPILSIYIFFIIESFYIRSQVKAVGHYYLTSLKVGYQKNKKEKGKKKEIMERERKKMLATIGINKRLSQSQML